MIYTITTNPSLDYYLKFDKPLVVGDHNRSIEEYYDAGGKGVNVSIFLNNLGIQSVCLGFLGGFTKDIFLSKLSRYQNLQPLFTSVEDNTRVNIKAIYNNQTSLNTLGPCITNDEYDRFIKRASKIYDDDYIVLSGSVQNELKDKIVELVTNLSKVGTKVILDGESIITEKCLNNNLYLVKFNDENSGTDENDIVSKAKDYLNKGVKYIIYSSPINSNFYLICEEGVYKTCRSDNEIVNMASGDSMIAGFLFSALRGANALESFKYAVACSRKLSLNDSVVDRNELDALFNKIEVTNLWLKKYWSCYQYFYWWVVRL